MDYSNRSSSVSPESVAIIPRSSASAVANEPYFIGSSRYGADGSDDSESESILLEYWRILYRHKKAILISALCGLLLGFLVGIPMTPVYRARTSLEVLNLNGEFMNMKQANPTTTSSNDYETSEEQTQAKLLEGNALLHRVIAKLDPDAAASLSKAAGKKEKMATSGWRSWFHLPEASELTPRQKLLANAADSLKIKPTARTRILEITIDSKDAQLAASFADILLQEFIQQNQEANYSATHKTSEWLGREIDDVRARLQTSEDALQAYARQNQLIFTDQEDDTNVATEKLKQLQQELSTATGDRIAKQSRFELAKSSPPEALADVLHDENLEESRSKVEDKRRQIADLSAVFNPEYTKLKRVQAELTALEATYDNGRTNMLKSIENDYQQAISKEALLLAAYNAQTAEVTALSQKQIQYNILKRELDSNRQLYDTMLQQTKQASLASAMRASNVRVVDPAEIPTIPVFPNFKLNSAIGLFVGLLLSTVIVILRERADRTLQQPSDIKLWTDLAELGTIPRASTGIEATYGKYGASLPGAKRDRALRPRNQPRPVELITSEYKSSVIAEAFRSVLTSLLFVGENGSRPRVIVFTSSSPSDGKTTVVSNLAIATAEIRRKILVIDADLRRPRMHSIFNLPNDRGLTDLLSEDFSERSLTSLIHRTNIEGLDVLPGGPPAQAAAHLLHSPNFAAMLSMLRKEYDMILIDTPPMYQMTDARVAGRLADAVVLVARAGQTTRDSLLVIKDRFVEDRIRVLGAILNDWDPKRSPNGHYSRQYGRYYGRSVPENVQNN